MVLSTFHRTLAYGVADGAFLAVPGACGGGVGAMTLAGGGGGTVLLGRYTGEESVYSVFDLDVPNLLKADPATLAPPPTHFLRPALTNPCAAPNAVEPVVSLLQNTSSPQRAAAARHLHHTARSGGSAGA